MADATRIERWRPVVAYDGYYEVSDYGRVRSVDRVVVDKNGRSMRWRGKFLSQFPHQDGYPRVTLCKDNVPQVREVHSLVAEAFIGPRPPGQECRHKDGNNTNCHWRNLTYGTHQENIRDTIRHKTHHNSKKKKCKHGHRFTKKNTRWFVTRAGNPGRKCVKCLRIRDRERRRHKVTLPAG